MAAPASVGRLAQRLLSPGRGAGAAAVPAAAPRAPPPAAAAARRLLPAARGAASTPPASGAKPKGPKAAAWDAEPSATNAPAQQGTPAHPATPGGGLPSAGLAVSMVAGGLAGVGVYLYSRHGGQPEPEPKVPEPEGVVVEAEPKEPEVDPAVAAAERERAEREAAEAAAEAAAALAKKEAVVAALRAAIEATHAADPRQAEPELQLLRGAVEAVQAEAALPPSDALLAEAGGLARLFEGAAALRGTISFSLKELRSAVNEQHLVAGRLALKELSEAEDDLSKLGQTQSLEKLRLKLDINQAKAQLDDMEVIYASSRELGEGRVKLKDALEAKDTKQCAAAIEGISRATMSLQRFMQDIPDDGGLLSNGMQRLTELIEEEEAAARRAAAVVALESAVLERVPGPCQQALEEAKDAGVEHCPLMELARILADSEGLCQALACGAAEQLTELRRTHGVDVRDFSEAAASLAPTLTDQQLRENAATLAAAIMRNHDQQRRDLDEQLPVVAASLKQACENRMDNALNNINKEHDGRSARHRQSLEGRYAELTERAVGEVRAAVEQRGEEQREQQRASFAKQRALEEKMRRERVAVRENLAGLKQAIEALTELARNGERSADDRGQAALDLAHAQAELQAALSAGDVSQGEQQSLQSNGVLDPAPVLSQVLQNLPWETVARISASIPAEPELRESFGRQLTNLKAAALTPHADGLAEYLLAGFAGGLLARLYSLQLPHGRPFPLGTPTEEARRNLNVISDAAPLVELGDFKAAVVTLEGLTGDCRRAAASWVQEAREALLLQQSVLAVTKKVAA